MVEVTDMFGERSVRMEVSNGGQLAVLMVLDETGISAVIVLLY